MKNFFFSFLSILTSIVSNSVFAADGDTGLLGDSTTGMTTDKIRGGDISFDDIPKMISFATTTILGFAATIAVVMIIYGAFQMSLMGLTSEDKKKGADTIKHGIIGFVIAVSAWFIVNTIIANL